MDSTSDVNISPGSQVVLAPTKLVNGVDRRIWGHQQRPKMSGLEVAEVPVDSVILSPAYQNWIVMYEEGDQQGVSLREREVLDTKIISDDEYAVSEVVRLSGLWQQLLIDTYANVDELCDLLLCAKEVFFRNSLIRLLFNRVNKDPERNTIGGEYSLLVGYLDSLERDHLSSDFKERLLERVKCAFDSFIADSIKHQGVKLVFNSDELTPFKLNVGEDISSKVNQEFWQCFAGSGDINFILKENGASIWQSSPEPFFKILLGQDKEGGAVIPSQLLKVCSGQFDEMMRQAGDTVFSQYRDCLLLGLAQVSRQCLERARIKISEQFGREIFYGRGSQAVAPVYDVRVGEAIKGSVLTVEKRPSGELEVSFCFKSSPITFIKLDSRQSVSNEREVSCRVDAELDGSALKLKTAVVEAKEAM